MITTNRNVFLGIHITPRVKRALVAEMERRKNSHLTGQMMSQSYVSYELLRQALIAQGYTDLETDEIY